MQKLLRLCKGDALYTCFSPARSILFLLQFVLQKIISGHTEQRAHLQQLFQFRHGLRALPFGHRLTGYIEFFGQFFL